MKTLVPAFACVAALAAAAAPALAADAGVTRAYAAPTAPIASTAVVPAGYTTIYLSGLTPSPATPPAAGAAPAYGDTEAQAESVFQKIDAALAAQGASAADVVSMHVFLVGDPAQGGKMDFAGMMKAYLRHYGTAAQPNKPTRTTVQVASLVGPGMLVEIDCVAVRKAGP
ncbi:MAG TPA: Rid family hydrolase [Caulobacteraceae bacterium]|nr:Rid family hydrolase [Caulobacteraceae bacterium]